MLYLSGPGLMSLGQKANPGNFGMVDRNNQSARPFEIVVVFGGLPLTVLVTVL